MGHGEKSKNSEIHMGQSFWIIFAITMLKRFKTYLSEQGIKTSGQTFLLAVSGGIDSVCMVDLFKKAGLKFAIAHCNFGLRGDESEEDEEFCKNLAATMGVGFYIKKFYMKKQKATGEASVQLAARELRYEWFNALVTENKFHFLVTAHHLDDSAETMLLNMARGTGLSGLHGILPKRETLLRPLMFAGREMLFEYANKNKLEWREDSSNSTDNYTRNFIRHHVLKSLKQIVPHAVLGFANTAGQIGKTEKLLQNLVEDFIDRNADKKSDRIILPLKPIQELDDPVQLLFYWLKPHNFSITQLENIFNSEKTTAKTVSNGFELRKSRENLVLTEIVNLPSWESTIKKPLKRIQTPVGDFVFQKVSGPKKDCGSNTLFIDADLLENASIRTWRNGDKIALKGMKGNKKLSDLFTDLKADEWKKKNTPLLCSGEKVFWVVGLRVSRDVELNGEGNGVVKIQFLPSSN